MSVSMVVVGFCFTRWRRVPRILVMPRSLVLLVYNIFLPVLFVIAFPAWLLKMWRRGGYGTGLRERFAIFDALPSEEPQNVIYVHAVSVGEVLIALKLITAMLEKEASLRIVLAATTSTGHAVAKAKAPEGVRVIYSPLDFGVIVCAVLNRFSPRRIVLIEAEMWPNLLRIAQKRNIPVSIVNARLSSRSEARFRKMRCLVTPIFDMVSWIGVQDAGDGKRFEALGVESEKIHVTGSIKFAPLDGQRPKRREPFQELLDDFVSGGSGARPVLLMASTHAGEEKMIASAVKRSGADVTMVVVPRHAERRAEVVADLASVGYEPILKTDYRRPEPSENACLVVDTTGELCDWTAHADWVVIGKSWLGKGGQNPAEAIIAGVPVICGPHMENFQPLVSQLCAQGGVMMLNSGEDLDDLLQKLVSGEIDTSFMVGCAEEVLHYHKHAVEKTLELLEVNASVRNEKRVEE